MKTKEKSRGGASSGTTQYDYIARRLKSGDQRQYSYPQNGIPKTKVKEKAVESFAVKAFGLDRSTR